MPLSCARSIKYEKRSLGTGVQTEDVAVEHIDLIREAKELPHLDRSKIGNRQPVTTTSAGGSADDDESESNSDYSEGFAEERPTYTKLEEIDLLSSIGRDIGVDFEKYAQPVPDVVAMESIESIRQPRSSSVIKNHMEDTNKLLDRELSETSSADARKKEKMAKNQAKRRQQQQQQQQSRNSNSQRRPDKRRADIDNGSGEYIRYVILYYLFYYISASIFNVIFTLLLLLSLVIIIFLSHEFLVLSLLLYNC